MLGSVVTQVESDAMLRDAIEALLKAESLLDALDRAGLLKKLDELKGAVESIPQAQLDLRIARIRLQSQIQHDPDKTPVHRLSSAGLRLKLDEK